MGSLVLARVLDVGYWLPQQRQDTLCAHVHDHVGASKGGRKIVLNHVRQIHGKAQGQADEEGQAVPQMAAAARARAEEEAEGGGGSGGSGGGEFAPAPAPALAPVTPGDAAGDAAAAAAPAASAADGSTGGATTHPRDDEATSPNRGPLKKQSVVQHSDSDPTKQLTFTDEAAAAAAAAAAPN